MRDATAPKAPDATVPVDRRTPSEAAMVVLKGVSDAVVRCLEALSTVVDDAVTSAVRDVADAGDRSKPVTWTLTDDDAALWECEGCHCEWTFAAGDPTDNGMKFCPGCGHPISGLVYHPGGAVQGELDLEDGK